MHTYIEGRFIFLHLLLSFLLSFIYLFSKVDYYLILLTFEMITLKI